MLVAVSRQQGHPSVAVLNRRMKLKAVVRRQLKGDDMTQAQLVFCFVACGVMLSC